MRKRLLIASSFAILMLFPVTVSSQQLVDCEPAGVSSPARCGTITVPLDHSRPDGPTLDLQVVLLPARAEPRQADPVFYLAGGPGQAATRIAAAMDGRRSGPREVRDLVFVDQRGTGADSPLNCPIQTDRASLFGRLLPSAAQLKACLDSVHAHTDPRFYTTAQSARDLELARTKLGYGQINLIGGSYGTRLALEYLRLHPQRVRAAILTGAVPPDFRAPLMYSRYAQEALDRLFADCAAEPDCAAAFPHLQRAWNELLSRVRRQPAAVEIGWPDGMSSRVTFNADDLAYTVRTMLYSAAALELPLLIDDAWRTGDLTRFAQVYARREASIRTVLSVPLHLSIFCSEDVPFITDGDAAKWSADAYLGDYVVREYRRACAVWPRAAQQIATPVTAERPVLILSGNRDPSTPPATGDEVAATLPRSVHGVFRFGGHGFPGVGEDGCDTAIRDDFLATADSGGMDLACIATSTPLPFRLPNATVGGR